MGKNDIEALSEQRDAEITKLAQKLVSDWAEKMLAGDERAISDLHNTVLDRLTEDDAKALFVEAATSHPAADVRFAKLAAEAMFAVCLADAERAVEFVEQTARQVAAEDRADRAWMDFQMKRAERA